MRAVRGASGTLLFATVTALLLVGVAASLADAAGVARASWILGTLVGLVTALASTIGSLRRRQPDVDVIAVLALVGALLVDEPLAGAVIAVMLATGRLLEERAARRARNALSLLLERAPRSARRLGPQGAVTIPVEQVVPGDELLVAAGEVVPVDGRLDSEATIDASVLTGEPLPVELRAGDELRSGMVNAATPFTMHATATSEDSSYAGVIKLVREAEASSAPFVRTADRFAVWFVPFTLIIAGASWIASGDPVRAVAVLVVATPCPLLLAAPIAIMSGLSRTARIGVVVKGGGALERLAAGHVMLFDKTGTLTSGRPSLTGIVTDGSDGNDAGELLRVAASLDQYSPHVLATSLVTAARDRGMSLTLPTHVQEVHGYGLAGEVDGLTVRLGKPAWILGETFPAWARQVRRRADLDGSLTVFVSVDDRHTGAFLFEDPIRPDAPRMIRSLRAAGIEHVVLVTGDREDIANTVGRVVGIDEVLADRDPAAKVAAIASEAGRAPTIMVGDGVNDAPALAAAGVGVALASRGATASSEAADVVLTVDRVEAVADALAIARRARGIAVQAVVVGMGLSVVAMFAAAAGLLPPTVGALLQEGIDVLAIGIALRAAVAPRHASVDWAPRDLEVTRALKAEHDAVLPQVERIRAVADALTLEDPDPAPVLELLDVLEQEVLPHEHAEEAALGPIMTRNAGHPEAFAAMSRTHVEIEHQVSRLRRLLTGVDGDRLLPEDVVEIRRLLYGLYAVLRLHNAQEEEQIFSLLPARTTAPDDNLTSAEGRNDR